MCVLLYIDTHVYVQCVCTLLNLYIASRKIVPYSNQSLRWAENERNSQRVGVLVEGLKRRIISKQHIGKSLAEHLVMCQACDFNIFSHNIPLSSCCLMKIESSYSSSHQAKSLNQFRKECASFKSSGMELLEAPSIFSICVRFAKLSVFHISEIAQSDDP